MRLQISNALDTTDISVEAAGQHAAAALQHKARNSAILFACMLSTLFEAATATTNKAAIKKHLTS
jgi:hypothetical protein